MPPPGIPPEAPVEICRALGANLGPSLGFGAAKQTFLIKLSGPRPLALKIISGAFPPERLEREIEAMKSCDLASIARLHSVSTLKVGGVLVTYILEEYLDGGSLTERLRSGGLLSAPRTKTLISTLSDALAHLQARSLVHRDIKPDNIMFRHGSDAPVLVDFGIVRNLAKDSLTKSHASMGPGTPYFAAPEQLLNEKYQIDWRTDQFSLGVVGSICAFGIHPYAHPDDAPELTIHRVETRERPRPNFGEDAIAEGLGPLAVMIEPWSTRRFRTPVDLIAAWRA